MHDRKGFRLAALAAVACMMVACTPPSQSTGAAAGAIVATPVSNSAGWRTLFDGTSMAAFRGYRMDTMPSGWHIVDGTLTKTGSVDDLVTREKFANYELSLEWKLGAGGNSGVFYRVTEEYDHPYWSGPEYQLLDDAGHPDGKSRLTAAGAAYGIYPAPAGVVKPANQWNTTLLVVNGSRVQHWMNGQKLLQYDLLSPDWEAKVKASKFNAWPNYGRASTGYIGIQGDHDGVLSIRNVRIRVLK